jgi:formimidoylglutamate deiminase
MVILSEAKDLGGGTDRQVLEADLTWVDGELRAGVQVEIDEAGRIAAVGALGREPTLRLAGRALLPGFVTAHSHAFQRGLRGRGERFPAGAGSFWSWREAMYALVGGLDPAAFHRLTLQAFREMRAAGYTTVGEFHYLHHAGDGEDFALDELVLAAAREAGVRLVLLETYYRTGGIGRALEGAQRRFSTPSPQRFWEQVDHLGPLADPRTQTLGVAIHSVRAAAPEEIGELDAEARRRGLVVHMHVEEQPREIEECLATYGAGPLELVLREAEVTDHFTAVHCTHSDSAPLAVFLAAGGNLCLCPTTEANLGDGTPWLPERPLHGRLCLGSDSNSRIAPLEEMRWLEYGQRLARECRGVFSVHEGRVAQALLEAATVNGAAALAVDAGEIHPGLWADFVAIDLAASALAGWEPETLLESLIFGAAEDVITATWVGGHWQEHR